MEARMRRLRSRMVLVAMTLTSFLPVTSVHAQAPRTWVSSSGDDVNPCSRSLPCRTFAGAMPKTALNGEINCIDAGGFDVVTITKSITIDCHDVFASILNAGGNGINILFDN